MNLLKHLNHNHINRCRVLHEIYFFVELFVVQSLSVVQVGHQHIKITHIGLEIVKLEANYHQGCFWQM